MPSQIVWKGDIWRRNAIPAQNAGLTAAAMVMADTAVRNFGTEGGGVVGAAMSPLAGGPRTGRRPFAGRARYSAAPPGAFPGVRMGLLRRSVAFVSPDALGTPLRAAFGTAVRYGRWLELGTSKMAARPWIVRSAMESRGAASAAFVRVAKARLKAAGMSL